MPLGPRLRGNAPAPIDIGLTAMRFIDTNVLLLCTGRRVPALWIFEPSASTYSGHAK